MEGFSPAALAALERYPWPGNVRELEHAVEHAVVLGRGPWIEVADLPAAVRHGAQPVFSWNASNCAVAEDRHGNIYPSKAKSTERIDGIVACCEGIAAWMGAEQQPSGTPEIFFL